MSSDGIRKVCVIGASGKLGQYLVQQSLDRGYEVVGVCRERSVPKLDGVAGRITIVPGPTNDPDVIRRAVAGCDGVLTVLVPWGVHQYSSGTAQAVLDHAEPGARLVFSCGWHVPRDEKDQYSWRFRATMRVVTRLARLARVIDVDDQVEAARRSTRATGGGRWSAAATSRRARARGCRCGAGTSATGRSPAT